MKKRKMSQAWKNRIWNGSILAAFVAAMAVFVFLLQTEKRVLTEYEKEQVCVVTAAIPRGEKISAEMQSSILQSWKSTKELCRRLH